MHGSQYLAQLLKVYGVSHVFYVESFIRRVMFALEDLGVKRISVHSEKSAAYMADGFARLSGRPGVCMSQSVGAANLAAGLKDAFLGHAPVIAFTGREVPQNRHRNAYQEIFHQGMFDPVTKFNACVDSQEQLSHLVDQAFREATTGTPQPVHLDLLGHLGQATENWEVLGEPAAQEQFMRYPAFRPTAEADRLSQACRLLERAKRPVIVAGGGATASGAGPELMALAEKRGIPVATSLDGKSLLPNRHPLCMGVVGSYSAWCANRVVSRADLVFFVGSGADGQVTNGWTIPTRSTPVIHLDLNPAELGRNYPRTFGLWGDPKTCLARMAQELEPGTDRAWAEQAGQVVKEWEKEIAPLCASDDTPIRVERLCRELSLGLPEDAVLVADTGYAGIWTGAMVYLDHPGQTYLRCAGTLGWAFPASLGAKCAAPDRPVVCFTGDGGFYYHLTELETASRYGLNTVTVVNNNSRFGQVESSLNSIFGQPRGNWQELIFFGPVDFAAVARDFGCLGIRVEKPAELAPALGEALQADRPVVLDVITDPACQALSPWTPKVRI